MRVSKTLLFHLVKLPGIEKNLFQVFWTCVVLVSLIFSMYMFRYIYARAVSVLLDSVSNSDSLVLDPAC
jgi:hypothetical protein